MTPEKRDEFILMLVRLTDSLIADAIGSRREQAQKTGSEAAELTGDTSGVAMSEKAMQTLLAQSEEAMKRIDPEIRQMRLGSTSKRLTCAPTHHNYQLITPTKAFCTKCGDVIKVP